VKYSSGHRIGISSNGTKEASARTTNMMDAQAVAYVNKEIYF